MALSLLLIQGGVNTGQLVAPAAPGSAAAPVLMPAAPGSTSASGLVPWPSTGGGGGAGFSVGGLSGSWGGSWGGGLGAPPAAAPPRGGTPPTPAAPAAPAPPMRVPSVTVIKDSQNTALLTPLVYEAYCQTAVGDLLGVS